MNIIIINGTIASLQLYIVRTLYVHVQKYYILKVEFGCTWLMILRMLLFSAIPSRMHYTRKNVGE
jgi:hypothetical protein